MVNSYVLARVANIPNPPPDWGSQKSPNLRSARSMPSVPDTFNKIAFWVFHQSQQILELYHVKPSF